MSECRPDPDCLHPEKCRREAKECPSESRIEDQESSVQSPCEVDWMTKSDWNREDWQGLYDVYSSMDRNLVPTEMVTKHVAELLPHEPVSVFLPLCGKSYDLKWLYDRGNTVYGVEIIEKPVREFFEYHKLPHSVKSTLWGGKLYKTNDGRLQVHVCDILFLPSEAIEPVDAVLDYGAYTAINVADRQQYWAKVESFLKEEHRILLEVCHDAPPDYVGSPHSISFYKLKKTFGAKYSLSILSTRDISEDMGFDIFNSFVLLTPKSK